MNITSNSMESGVLKVSKSELRECSEGSSLPLVRRFHSICDFKLVQSTRPMNNWSGRSRDTPTTKMMSSMTSKTALPVHPSGKELFKNEFIKGILPKFRM